MRMHAPQQIDSRRGMTLVGTTSPGNFVHSLRRLNSGASFIRLAGADTRLIELVSPTLFPETFSGNPLSMVPFRPEQSPLPWMYIADSLQMRKISMALEDFLMGVAPPLSPPTTGFGPVSFQDIYDFSTETSAADWIAGGTGAAMAPSVQFSANVTAIVPDAGPTFPQFASAFLSGYTTGNFASVLPNTIAMFTAVSLPANLPITGTIAAAFASSTISSIVFQSGTTGACTIKIPSSAALLTNGALVYLSGTEYVQAKGCVQNPDGSFTFQAVTTLTHANGDSVVPKDTVRFYVPYSYPPSTFVGVALTSWAMQSSMTPGSANWVLTALKDLSTTLTNGVRQIQTTGATPDTIYLAMQVNLSWPDITSVKLDFDVDSTTNNFSVNYYSYTKNSGFPSSGSGWFVIAIPITSLSRIGSDATRTLANVAAIRITVNDVGTPQQISFSSFWVGGNYGPSNGSAPGYQYRVTARSTETGATSNGSPATQTAVSTSAGGQPVAIYMGNDSDLQLATYGVYDVYRFGGTLLQWTFLGTMPNPTIGATSVFFDVYPESAIASNPILQTDNFQPFPTVDTPKSGVVNVNGRTVSWVSGNEFNVNWSQGTQITINGVLYSFYQQPANQTTVVLNQVAGELTNVPYQIEQATILGVPLPCLWGPFSQGTASFLFAVGDLNQPGVLFLTKGNNPDAGPDTLQIEITSPSEPLMNGCMYDGTSFVWSSDRLFRLYPLFGSSLIVENGVIQQTTGTNLFTPIEVPNGKGLWARWGIAVGPKIWFIGRDGIYETTGGEPKPITLGDWSKLFPHEGGPGVSITLPAGFGGPLLPPDTTQPNKWRLSYADGYLYFDYPDPNGIPNTLVYDTETESWGVDVYNPFVTLHYGEEGAGVHSILLGTSAAQVCQFSQSGFKDLANPVQFGLAYPLMNEGGGEYSLVREALLGILSLSSDLNSLVLDVQVDLQVLSNVQLFALIGGVGVYERIYTPVPAGKGRLQGWSLIGDGPFTLVMRDCEMHGRKWGSDGPWEKINPFSSQRRVQTPVIG